jgi:hypothetical protein
MGVRKASRMEGFPTPQTRSQTLSANPENLASMRRPGRMAALGVAVAGLTAALLTGRASAVIQPQVIFSYTMSGEDPASHQPNDMTINVDASDSVSDPNDPFVSYKANFNDGEDPTRSNIGPQASPDFNYTYPPDYANYSPGEYVIVTGITQSGAQYTDQELIHIGHPLNTLEPNPDVTAPPLYIDGSTIFAPLVNVMDADIADTDGSQLAIAGDANGPEITTQATNGTCEIDPLADGQAPNQQTITYTPQAGYTGPDSCSYTVEDSRGFSAPATASFQVKDVGNPDIQVKLERQPLPTQSNGVEAINIPGNYPEGANDFQYQVYKVAAGAAKKLIASGDTGAEAYGATHTARVAVGAAEYEIDATDQFGNTSTKEITVHNKPGVFRPHYKIYKHLYSHRTQALALFDNRKSDVGARVIFRDNKVKMHLRSFWVHGGGGMTILTPLNRRTVHGHRIKQTVELQEIVKKDGKTHRITVARRTFFGH